MRQNCDMQQTNKGAACNKGHTPQQEGKPTTGIASDSSVNL
jgi:hypothetical protein